VRRRGQIRSLRARFTFLAAGGVLALACGGMAIVGWFEYSGVESRLHAFAANELGSLNALVETVM
jgi:hypothetical protein